MEDSDSDDEEVEKTINVENYGPCPRCFGWITLNSIKRHVKMCVLSKDGQSAVDSKGMLKVQSDILCDRLSTNASESLVKEVYPIMVNDDVSKIAKEDNLIISLGNQWMLRNKGNQIMRKYYTSSVKRLAAKMKMAVQHFDGSKSELEEYLQPKYFEIVVKGALICCLPADADEEDLKSPSNTIKLGHDVKRIWFQQSWPSR